MKYASMPRDWFLQKSFENLLNALSVCSHELLGKSGHGNSRASIAWAITAEDGANSEQKCEGSHPGARRAIRHPGARMAIRHLRRTSNRRIAIEWPNGGQQNLITEKRCPVTGRQEERLWVYMQTTSEELTPWQPQLLPKCRKICSSQKKHKSQGN